ncbi:MAG TPA: hypothetical protein VK775_08645 [Chthoniobacterales bacterium]|nr:hypothetical protein [Chthoniobacterales bacterium]
MAARCNAFTGFLYILVERSLEGDQARIFGSIVNFQMPVDHIGSRKTIGAVIIAATTPSEPAAKIVSGVHSAWF